MYGSNPKVERPFTKIKIKQPVHKKIEVGVYPRFYAGSPDSVGCRPGQENWRISPAAPARGSVGKWRSGDRATEVRRVGAMRSEPASARRAVNRKRSLAVVSFCEDPVARSAWIEAGRSMCRWVSSSSACVRSAEKRILDGKSLLPPKRTLFLVLARLLLLHPLLDRECSRRHPRLAWTQHPTKPALKFTPSGNRRRENITLAEVTFPISSIFLIWKWYNKPPGPRGLGKTRQQSLLAQFEGNLWDDPRTRPTSQSVNAVLTQAGDSASNPPLRE